MLGTPRKYIVGMGNPCGHQRRWENRTWNSYPQTLKIVIMKHIQMANNNNETKEYRHWIQVSSIWQVAWRQQLVVLLECGCTRGKPNCSSGPSLGWASLPAQPRPLWSRHRFGSYDRHMLTAVSLRTPKWTGADEQTTLERNRGRGNTDPSGYLSEAGMRGWP